VTGEYIAPSIKVITNLIDYSDRMIEIAKSAPDSAWRDSGFGDQFKYDNSVRRSREISIPYSLDKPKIFFEFAQAIHSAAKSYAMENNFTFSHMEEINILEYQESEGFFDIHSDSGPSFPRSMSALLYLNDVEDGGETWFDKFGLMIKPEKGKLVLFPANYAYTHQALPPKTGKKYVAVTWFGQTLDSGIFEEYYP